MPTIIAPEDPAAAERLRTDLIEAAGDEQWRVQYDTSAPAGVIAYSVDDELAELVGQARADAGTDDPIGQLDLPQDPIEVATELLDAAHAEQAAELAHANQDDVDPDAPDEGIERVADLPHHDPTQDAQTAELDRLALDAWLNAEDEWNRDTAAAAAATAQPEDAPAAPAKAPAKKAPAKRAAPKAARSS